MPEPLNARGRASRRGSLHGVRIAAALIAVLFLVAPIVAGARPPAPQAPVAAVANPPAPAAGPAEYAGTDTCIDCHGTYDRKMIESPHRSLFAKGDDEVRGCESCHGPSKAHAESDGEKPPFRNFRAKTRDEMRAVNKACLECHREEKLQTFENKGHGRSGRTSCLSCHSMHTPKFNQLLVARDPAACYQCHPGMRAQMNMPSHHPIREGKMTCTGCHNPHGSPSGAKAMLDRETVNETCNKCHQNLAGPWAFEHPPVAKNCTICHRPHGSVNVQLLTQPEVSLCLKCHNPEHGGFAARRDRNRSLQRQLAYQSCYNCHSKIHGSDNDHGFLN